MLAQFGKFFVQLNLSQRFMLASFVILLAGMTGPGEWVGKQIELGVVHRTAATTALFVDSFIAPNLQELATDYFTPSLAANLLAEMAGGQHPSKMETDPLDELTKREREILEHIAIGLSNKEVGQHLHVSEKTVKHYVTSVLQKLQVRNRVEAALLVQKSQQAKW